MAPLNLFPLDKNQPIFYHHVTGHVTGNMQEMEEEKTVGRSRITIRDVAAQAGVSHQTVSRVINGSKRVSPETRARVEATIAEMGYRPNAIAQSMASGRTGMLACLSPNMTDYTFASIINGAETEARRCGYFLLSASAPDSQTFASLVEQLAPSRRAEGLIVINPYQDARFRHLPTNFPIVFAGARPRAEAASSVALDDVAVGRLATEHLLAQGHQAIGQVTGPMAEDCSQDRMTGFQVALHEADIAPQPEYIIEGNWQAVSGYDALMQIAATGALPSAVFAQNDQMAAGVLRAARDLGINVPQQLMVIGVDDIPMAPYFEPPLTTLRQDFTQIGAEAVRLLIETIRQPQAPRQHLRLPAVLVRRRSTGATT